MNESPERDERHLARMQRKKAIMDERIASAPNECGLLLVLHARQVTFVALGGFIHGSSPLGLKKCKREAGEFINNRHTFARRKGAGWIRPV